MRIAILSLLLLLPLAAQEEVRKNKKGWADLGVRLEGKGTVAEVFPGVGRKAGLKVGDVITSFNGKRMDAEEIMSALWSMNPKSTVKLVVDRDGDEMKFEFETKMIRGQIMPGNNNRIHHPPALRAVRVKPVAACEGGSRAVYAFDITVSFNWKLTDGEMADAKEMVNGAAAIFTDATEGQMYWRTVTLYNNKVKWDRAQYRIWKRERGGLGVEHVTPGGQCNMYFSGRLNTRTPIVIFAHEAVHMQLGVGDEYPYRGADQQEDCVCVIGRGCFRGVHDLCTKESHSYVQKTACWDSVKRWYPDLRKPDKTVKGPKLTLMPRIILGRDLEADLMRLIEARYRKIGDEVIEAVRGEIRKAFGD